MQAFSADRVRDLLLGGTFLQKTELIPFKSAHYGIEMKYVGLWQAFFQPQAKPSFL